VHAEDEALAGSPRPAEASTSMMSVPNGEAHAEDEALAG
jgi:hypothetical protein